MKEQKKDSALTQKIVELLKTILPTNQDRRDNHEPSWMYRNE